MTLLDILTGVAEWRSAFERDTRQVREPGDTSPHGVKRSPGGVLGGEPPEADAFL